MPRTTTGDDRLILFCDVERPLKTQTMTAVNRWVGKHVINESATQNEEGERVGWINRAFGQVYQVRLLGKRMKAWNKRVYYAVKYLLIGGILAAFSPPLSRERRYCFCMPAFSITLAICRCPTSSGRISPAACRPLPRCRVREAAPDLGIGEDVAQCGR